MTATSAHVSSQAAHADVSTSPGQVVVDLARDDAGWWLTLTTPGPARDLSDLLPAVEAFGLHVVDATTDVHDGHDRQRLAVTSLHDLVHGHVASTRSVTTTPGTDRITTALAAVLEGRMPADPLLELVTATSMTWPQVDVLRAYRRLFDLLGNAWYPTQVTRTLLANPTAASELMALFDALLSPDHDTVDVAHADHALENVRAGISSLAQDRIIADLARAVHATLRTNAFASDRSVAVSDERAVDVLALKVRSADLPGVPTPVPHTEILVTSSLTTGVHLRGGPISRGGVRASDRPDDLRDEVLGLLATQITKNSMIVPTGAKGGFVLEQPPTDAADMPDAVEAAYRIYVQGLLAVTDNVVEDRVVGPGEVVRRDGDDPYLVVAPDKGTARLSDTANELAREAGFWLGDAFASGGSSGYDHKALGITARGAWTAIARHFRELGVDLHVDPITLVGIGDMSGDVFGNGLLTSDRLRLVAAFDHRDIFLDPDPDPATAFAERSRLFNLSRSSWQDYDRDALSPGGGVFSRQAKQVEVTPQVRERLDIDDALLTPDALIRAILRARVDLLYAGGIGTYVAGSDEDEVNDIGNAAIRVTADEVRARVIGEGANLAVTQRARIEFARRGGRVDQDAVHNAAGVAISDREVNLKILMAPLVARGELSHDDRDELLQAATDEVVAGVIDDVDAQVWLLSRQHAESATHLAAQQRQIERLVATGTIDRDDDVLPTNEQLAARAEVDGGLTRPELATVVAATKRALVAAVRNAPLVHTSTARQALIDYFPASVVDAVGDTAVANHHLADEITALRMVSDLVDRHGPTLVHELATEYDVEVPAVVAALRTAQAVLGGHDWWTRLRGLAREVPVETLDVVATILADLEAEIAMTIVRDGPTTHLDALVDHLGPIAAAIDATATDSAGRGTAGTTRVELVDDLVPDDLAVVAATAHLRSDLADVAWLVEHPVAGPPPDPTAVDADDVTMTLTALDLVDDRLYIRDVRHAVHEHLAQGWERRHGLQLDQDLRDARRRAAATVLAQDDRAVSGERPAVARARKVVHSALAESRTPPSAPLAVAVAAIRRAVDTITIPPH